MDGAQTAGTLPATSVAAYQAQGFVHVPRVLAGEEVNDLLPEAQRVLEREDTLSWDDDGGRVMDWVADPELKSDAMRALALHPRVTAIAERLAGGPLRLFKTELLRKRAGDSTGTPAHIDTMGFPIADHGLHGRQGQLRARDHQHGP